MPFSGFFNETKDPFEGIDWENVDFEQLLRQLVKTQGGGGTGFGSNTGGLSPQVKAILAAIASRQGGNQYTGSPSGTGLGFLSGLEYLDRPLGDPGALIDPTAGGYTQFPGPFLLGKFLQGEMGPGGYLAPGAQSRELARGVHDLYSAGSERLQSFLDSAGASGLNRSRALTAARDIPLQTTQQVESYYNQGIGDLEQKRFDAVNAFVNSTLAHAEAGKTAQLQEKVAKEGAAATTEAGKLSGLGALAGGLLSRI